MSSKYIPGYGSPAAKLIICGEAPGRIEEEEGRPFVGPTGQETRSMLRTAGMAPEECFFMNVFPYRPPNNDFKRIIETGHTLEEGIEEMWMVLKSLTDANCVLALGNVALHALTGETQIQRWRGSILKSLYTHLKVVPSIHPANLFERHQFAGRSRGLIPYRAKMYMQLDFNRAVEESQSRELELPHRKLWFVTKSLDLYDFLDRNIEKQGRRRAASDIESHKCIPFCTSIAFSRHEALSVPLMDLGHMDPKFRTTQSDISERWRLIDKFYRDERIEHVGQNFKYDQDKLETVCRFKVHKLFLDTMLLAKTVNPEFPGALEFSTSIYTREPYYKDEWRKFDPRKDKIEKVLIYNARDSAVCFEVMEELLKELEEAGLTKFFFEFVMPLHDIYLEMESVGFKIDQVERDRLYTKYVRLQLEAEDELFKLTGYPVNCNSPNQVKLLLFSNLKIPRRAGTDEDTLVSLLANTVKNEVKKRILSLIIDIRRLANVKSKLAARPDYDGRMRTSYRIVGTESGRTSTSILKAPLRPHKIGMSAHSITKHGELGGDIRKQFIPRSSDYVFMNCDLSQAEARVVAILSDDQELLSWFRDGVDVHARTASFIFGGEETSYLKKEGKEPPERAVGKIGRHAYAYCTSDRRLSMEVNTQARRFGIDISISIWRAKKILEILDEKCPAIQQNYWPAIREIAHTTRTIRCSNGRLRYFGDRLNEDLYREMYSYIPQVEVSDKTKLSMIQLKKKFPKLIFVIEAHDAFCMELHKSMIQDVAGYSKEYMESPIDFSECTIPRGQLIIPCDIEIGENYKDFKKLKF